MPAFISHHLLRGNTELIMKIERTIHFFYVYLPALSLLFSYVMTDTRNRFVVILSFIISFLFSLTTFTDYYFIGLYTYPWGHIAKGGIAFRLYGLYGFIVTIYFICDLIRNIKLQKNKITRLRLKYVSASFLITALLTILNIPAMNGINFYPMGNFCFIPLLFLGYGVLSYRLMDVKSVLHETLMWAVMSSLILIPNIAIFIYFRPYFSKLGNYVLSILFIAWFIANYFYLSKVQPLIDQLFNRRKYDLYKIESSFIENISTLKTLEDLTTQFTDLIKNTLFFKTAELVICNRDVAEHQNLLSECSLDPDIEGWFVRTNHLIDCNMVESRSTYDDMRDKLLLIFRRYNATYLVPFIQQGKLLALLILPEKKNLRQITNYEVNFINNVRLASAIALDNSIMFSNLTILKEHLEQIVTERTAELTHTRDLLLYDLELAQKIQMTLLPQKVPQLENAEVKYKYVPMMGVGGDFIDIFVGSRNIAGDNKADILCCFICDVSGHGVPAALTASMVKMSLSSWEEFALKPAAHMSHISNSLHRKTGGNFITGIVCFLELNTGRFVFANAGHPPLIILRADGTAEPVGAKGKLISDIAPPDCEELEFFLNENDMVILYTDGIIEEKTENEFFGEDRFIDILKLNYRSSPEFLCGAVINSLIQFKGNTAMDDDLTIIAIQYKGTSKDKVIRGANN